MKEHIFFYIFKLPKLYKILFLYFSSKYFFISIDSFLNSERMKCNFKYIKQNSFLPVCLLLWKFHSNFVDLLTCLFYFLYQLLVPTIEPFVCILTNVIRYFWNIFKLQEIKILKINKISGTENNVFYRLSASTPYIIYKFFF